MLIQVDVSQVNRLAVDLARAGVNVRDPVDRELQKAAEAVSRSAREIVRKRTGRTARSISYQPRRGGLQYDIGPTWFVGRFLERGTVHMPAYPFMAPAAASQFDWSGRVGDAVAKATLTGGHIPGSFV